MGWTGLCPQCGHDRAEHVGSAPSPATGPDATEVLRCSVCACAVTDAGRPWPAAAVEEPDG